MQLTPSQAGAVAHRGSDLLVAASAGSGKTEVLARRVVALLSDPQQPAELSELAIVTFTRAAAAELRVRVARMLRAAQAAEANSRLASHLRRQEVLVGAAEIGTIDAWCGRILREHFDLAGIDAQFSVLAEEDAALLRREVLDELFEWIYAADEPVAAAARGWIERHARPSDEFLRRMVGELNRCREHLVDPEPWLAAQRAGFRGSDEEIRTAARGQIAAALRADCEFLAEEFGTLHAMESHPRVRGEIGALRDMLERARGALADPARLDEALALLAAPLPKRHGFSETETAASNRVRKWFNARIARPYDADAIRDLLENAPAAAHLALVLLDLESLYENRLQAEKRRRGALEFGDVLRHALDLLGTPDPAGPRRPTPLAERLRRRYAHILVDEFQDTSPVQVEIVRLLSRSDPGTTNRFLVGDVKQSIYGFRQAEPRLFARLRDELDGGAREGRVQPRSDNFRSHGHVLAVLNGLFEQLFDPRLGGSPYGERERLVARRAEIENPTLDGQPRVQVTLLEPPDRGQPAESDDDDDALLERVELEAVVAAEQILELRRRGVQIPQRSGDGVELRPLRFGDIVILLRAARKNAGLIAGVLRGRGIPVVTDRRESILETQESRDLVSVLRLLANRRQDIALAAYLRSPFVGLSDAELLDLRRSAKSGELHDAVAQVLERAPARPWHAKLRDGWRQLDAWSEAARELELPALLQRILSDGAYPLFVRGLPGGGHRVAVVQAVQQFAAQFARGGQRGVAEFVQFLEGLEETDVEPTAAVAAGEDVVRIMTIHAAKGLEFPIVFLLNAGAKFRLQRGSNGLRFDADGGLGLRFEDYPALRTLATPAYALLSQPQRTRELEEELRLLYVALTRARESLHVIGHHAAEDWNELKQRGGRPLLLLERLGARSMLEWVLLAAAAGELHDEVRTADARIAVHCRPRSEPPLAPPAPVPPPAPAPLTDDDYAWVERAARLMSAPPGDELSRTPAVLSVSALKELAQRDSGAPRLAPREKFPPRLAPPVFARGAARDTTDIGTATHRFLQIADLARLTDADAIRAMAEELRAARRLTPEETALLPIDDLAWLASTPEGALLRAAADNALRELPFTQAVPVATADGRTAAPDDYQIVRGVIDCLIPQPPGYILLDYKTDHIATGPALDERTRIYTVQLRQYAQAAAAALDAPVTAARLVFLHARQVVPVRLAD